MLTEDIIIVRVKVDIVLFDVSHKLISPEYLSDFHKLIVVVSALEEGFLLENHASEHAAKRPDVKRVVICLEINQKFRSFEVS